MFYASRVAMLPTRVVELLSAEVRAHAVAERMKSDDWGFEHSQGQHRNQDTRSEVIPLISEIS
jgi:regulator of sirC expression with transglutaminase-like and TPR domain